MIRLRLDLGYDGTDFHGWAAQPGQRTVQGELERALQVVLRLEQQPQVTVAGRTDAGVHARGQVAHVDLPKELVRNFERLLRSINGVLPDDVQVFALTDVPFAFDARFSALARRYSYRITDASAVDPLSRHAVVFHPQRLNVDWLNEGSRPLVGLHDFSAFCKKNDTGTTIRTLQEFAWHRDEYGVVVASVKADAFCHSMVRALVGAQLFVGDGRRPTHWPTQLLMSGLRESPVAPAHGLVLEEVTYPEGEDLLLRQHTTRQQRRATEVE